MNVFFHDGTIPGSDSQGDRHQRDTLLLHSPKTVWLTGLSGAGKSTLAYGVAHSLTALGVACYVLDGDELRRGLNSDLGFQPGDRRENIRRTAEVAAILNAAGVTVFASLISPLRVDREMACSIIGRSRFLEVHVATPLRVCEQRDPKGLYKKTRRGLLPEFTGISAPYEAPTTPDLAIDTSSLEIHASILEIQNLLKINTELD